MFDSWSQKWQLPLNLKKCNVICISNKRHQVRAQYFINITLVKHLDAVNTSIDQKLKWGDQVSRATVKANRIWIFSEVIWVHSLVPRLLPVFSITRRKTGESGSQNHVSNIIIMIVAAVPSNPCDYRTRLVWEAFLIKMSRGTLNRHGGTLPAEYENLIKPSTHLA